MTEAYGQPIWTSRGRFHHRGTDAVAKAPPDGPLLGDGATSSIEASSRGRSMLVKDFTR
jgi:hypothetical protein